MANCSRPFNTEAFLLSMRISMISRPPCGKSIPFWRFSSQWYHLSRFASPLFWARTSRPFLRGNAALDGFPLRKALAQQSD